MVAHTYTRKTEKIVQAKTKCTTKKNTNSHTNEKRAQKMSLNQRWNYTIRIQKIKPIAKKNSKNNKIFHANSGTKKKIKKKSNTVTSIVGKLSVW